jgi:hypothetical protein
MVLLDCLPQAGAGSTNDLRDGVYGIGIIGIFPYHERRRYNLLVYDLSDDLLSLHIHTLDIPRLLVFRMIE